MLPEQYYLGIVILLFALAITDLVVGVSNDAVNFLNSSIGSKVASRKVIMTIAGLGIFTGALFSSGMMEIARKGIFVPELFSFQEVMIIFLAVMLTDILLLDLFNSFGMPTSTTVSIVFELLGASVVMALLKLWFNDNPDADGVLAYINTSKAVAIIGGIFLSVFFAFSIGTIVQYATRLVYSFQIERAKSWVNQVFFSICLSSISYFLVFKGLSGVSFLSQACVAYAQEHAAALSGGAFVFWLVVGRALTAFQVNLLRVVVLFGTFSLAMSFAGNDLVNFIGVSIAGLESYLIWRSMGVAPDAFMMDALSEPIQTNTILLVLAGLIMVVTLWFSKKAQSVTDTEVKLGRQHDGDERFKPTAFARFMMKLFQHSNAYLTARLPERVMHKINARFEPVAQALPEEERPAFDLVRASINLTVASLLISLATSLKLPLSTTYVSFMVAMGTSLADRAWGSASAASRIAGVTNVVGGWFLTALIAFTVSGCFALLIEWGGVPAIMAITAAVFYSIYRTFRLHQHRSKKG